MTFNVKKVFFAVMLVAFLALGAPDDVQAQTAEQLRAQIAGILAQIQSLQAQIQNNSVVQTPVTPITNTDNTSGTFQYSRCPDLQFNLERGDRDSQVAVEVTMLQRFLAQDSQVYPEAEVTGYFGPATERAIQRFQVRHGIVSKGDYASTGYGRVGPRTRWAIKNSCSIGSTGTNSNFETHAFTVSPTKGPVSLEVTASFELRNPSCTSFELNWGDGSSSETQQSQGSVGCPASFVREQFKHVYKTPGTYLVTLRLGHGALTSLPTVGTIQVVAQNEEAVNYPIDPNAKAHITFAGTTGYAPFATSMQLRSEAPISCTSYEFDWGDGTASATKEAGTSPCLPADGYTREFKHIYKNAGTFTVRMRAGRGALTTLPWIEQSITVHNTRTGTSSSCFIEPNSGIAPHSVRARILLGGSLCDGNLTYTIDWGDSSRSETRTCVDQNNHYEELTHTYLSPAIYTARVQQSHPNAFFDEEVCTVNVSGSTIPNNNAVTNTCQSWTDGCNTCSRSYVGGSAVCTQRYCLQKGVAQCYQNFDTNNFVSNDDSLTYRITSRTSRTVSFTMFINSMKSCDGGLYTLYFGDSKNSPQPFPADFCQAVSREVTYKYAQDGTYTAVLQKDGIVVDQVTVVISGTSSIARDNLASVLTAIENFVRSLFK